MVSYYLVHACMAHRSLHNLFFYYRYGDHRDLHVLTHPVPTRRSSDLLEPSAGSVAIADALRDAGAGIVHCVEHHASLAEVLRLKGHSVDQMDFMETGGLNRLNSPVFSVDAVVMNPPFEKGPDVAHVLHADRQRVG